MINLLSIRGRFLVIFTKKKYISFPGFLTPVSLYILLILSKTKIMVNTIYLIKKTLL